MNVTFRTIAGCIMTMIVIIISTEASRAEDAYNLTIAGKAFQPAELNVKGAGLFRGAEAESGRAFVGHGRRAFVDSAHWKSELTRFGIDYLHLLTDQPILGKLRHFLNRRGMGGSAGR